MANLRYAELALGDPSGSGATPSLRESTSATTACALSYCKQVPVLVSHVEPVGQHAWQNGPMQAVVPGGQEATGWQSGVGVPGTWNVPLLHMQVRGLALAGQQLAAGSGHAPLTQVQEPLLQVALS